MKKISFIAAAVLASLSLAAHGGAGGGSMGAMSSSHMSAKGLSDTNGPSSADRERGLCVFAWRWHNTRRDAGRISVHRRPGGTTMQKRCVNNTNVFVA